MAGPNREIWRASSEPIEPPAPVTSTRRPAICSAIAEVSSTTGRRPSRSSTLTSRRSFAVGRLPMISLSGGSVSTSSPASVASSVSSRIVPAAAWGRAMMRVSASAAAATAAMSLRLPRTRTPSTRSRALRGSSSSRATGWKVVTASRMRFRVSSRPASPAPKTIARRAPVAGVACSRVRHERMTNRAVNITSMASAVAVNGTLRGTPCHRARTTAETRSTPTMVAVLPTSEVSSKEPRSWRTAYGPVAAPTSSWRPTATAHSHSVMGTTI